MTKLATVALVAAAALLGSVSAWKYQGHILGKSHANDAEI